MIAQSVEPVGGEVPGGFRGRPLSRNIPVCVRLGARYVPCAKHASHKVAPARSSRPSRPDYPHQVITWPNYPELDNSS